MLYHFSEDRCAVVSHVESFAATTSESLREAVSESALSVTNNAVRVVPHAVPSITIVREHTMIQPTTNHVKPKFLIHQYVQVRWGKTDSLAAVTLGHMVQKNMKRIYDKKA